MHEKVDISNGIYSIFTENTLFCVTFRVKNLQSYEIFYYFCTKIKKHLIHNGKSLYTKSLACR